MVLLPCPRLQREKYILSEALEDSSAPYSTTPGLDGHSSINPIIEEREMLDVIFRPPAPISENQGPLPTDVENPPSGSHTPRTHRFSSRRGRVRLASLSNKLRRRFSRDARLSKLAAKIPEAQCDHGNADGDHQTAQCTNASTDILGSAPASEGGYDSDAHNLLTPQITARLKSSSPFNLSVNRARKTLPTIAGKLARGTYFPGYDGTPEGRQNNPGDCNERQDQAGALVSLSGDREIKALHQNQLISLDSPNDAGSIHEPTIGRKIFRISESEDGRLHRSFSGTFLQAKTDRPSIRKSSSSSSLPETHETFISFPNPKRSCGPTRTVCIEPLHINPSSIDGLPPSYHESQTGSHHVQPFPIRLKGTETLQNISPHVPSSSANVRLQNNRPSNHERKLRALNWSVYSDSAGAAEYPPSQMSSTGSDSERTANISPYKKHPPFGYGGILNHTVTTKSPKFRENHEDGILERVSPHSLAPGLSPPNISKTSELHIINRIPSNQIDLKPSDRNSTGPIRSRFVENLDDVFSTHVHDNCAELDRCSQRRRENRSSSEGWLSGGKRVGYGYNFIADVEKEGSSKRLRSPGGQQDIINHGQQSPTCLTLRGKRRTVSESMGPEREAGHDTFEQLMEDPKVQEETRSARQQRLGTRKQRSSTFPPWVKLAGKSRRDRTSSVVPSSQEEELLNNNGMTVDTKADQSMARSNWKDSTNTMGPRVRSQGEPAPGRSGNSPYSQGHALKISNLWNPDESQHAPGSETGLRQRGPGSGTVYDMYDHLSDDEESVRSSIEPCSAEVWSRLYDDCVQLPSDNLDGLSSCSDAFNPPEQADRGLNPENRQTIMLSTNAGFQNSTTESNDLRLGTPPNSRATLCQIIEDAWGTSTLPTTAAL